MYFFFENIMFHENHSQSILIHEKLLACFSYNRIGKISLTKLSENLGICRCKSLNKQLAVKST